MSILVPNFSELRILWQITTLTKKHPETDIYFILLSILEEKGPVRTYPNLIISNFELQVLHTIKWCSG